MRRRGLCGVVSGRVPDSAGLMGTEVGRGVFVRGWEARVASAATMILASAPRDEGGDEYHDAEAEGCGGRIRGPVQRRVGAG